MLSVCHGSTAADKKARHSCLSLLFLLLTFGVGGGVGNLLKGVQKGSQDGDGGPGNKKCVNRSYQFCNDSGFSKVQRNIVLSVFPHSLEGAVKFPCLGNELIKVGDADLERNENN